MVIQVLVQMVNTIYARVVVNEVTIKFKSTQFIEKYVYLKKKSRERDFELNLLYEKSERLHILSRILPQVETILT